MPLVTSWPAPSRPCMTRRRTSRKPRATVTGQRIFSLLLYVLYTLNILLDILILSSPEFIVKSQLANFLNRYLSTNNTYPRLHKLILWKHSVSWFFSSGSIWETGKKLFNYIRGQTFEGRYGRYFNSQSNVLWPSSGQLLGPAGWLLMEWETGCLLSIKSLTFRRIRMERLQNMSSWEIISTLM